MSLSFSNRTARWFRARVLRFLGIEDVKSKLDTLEAGTNRLTKTLPTVLENIQKNLGRSGTELDSSVTTNILASLQRLTEGLVTLDQRITSYRSAQFISHLSEIYPKTKTVIFAGSSYFGGNIKYAYLAFHDRMEKNGVVCYFIPYTPHQYEQLKEAGLPCLPHVLSDYTSDEMSVLLSAKVLVLDNYFVPSNWRNQTPQALLCGAKTVQLWHGIPIKEIGMDTATSKKIYDPGSVEFFAACGTFDVFLGTNEASRKEWKNKFSFRSFAPVGFPRNDVFFRDLSESDMINVDRKVLDHAQTSSKNGQPLVLYGPTFRDREFGAWFKRAEISALADYCATKGYLFYVNLHPVDQDFVEQFRQEFPRINFIDPHTDVYPITKFASVFITDYSSLAFDFLLLDRPIMFYRPDHTTYIEKSRHLISDHDQYICGPLAANVSEAVKAIDSSVKAFTNKDADPYREARKALREKLYDYQDGLAANRLCDVISGLL
jgi:CDP-glycerol glycerophosphotransferase